MSTNQLNRKLPHHKARDILVKYVKDSRAEATSFQQIDEQIDCPGIKVLHLCSS